MYIYIYVRIKMHVNIRTYMYTVILMCLCVYIYIYIHVCMYVCMYVCICICICVCVYIYILYKYVFMCIYKHIYMYVSVYIHMVPQWKQSGKNAFRMHSLHNLRSKIPPGLVSQYWEECVERVTLTSKWYEQKQAEQTESHSERRKEFVKVAEGAARPTMLTRWTTLWVFEGRMSYARFQDQTCCQFLMLTTMSWEHVLKIATDRVYQVWEQCEGTFWLFLAMRMQDGTETTRVAAECRAKGILCSSIRVMPSNPKGLWLCQVCRHGHLQPQVRSSARFDLLVQTPLFHKRHARSMCWVPALNSLAAWKFVRHYSDIPRCGPRDLVFLHSLLLAMDDRVV